MSSHRRSLVPFLAAALLTTCSREPELPFDVLVVPPRDAVVDAPRGGPTPGFYWLGTPPYGPGHFEGAFDPRFLELDPVVEVCEIESDAAPGGDACVGPPIATLTRDLPLPPENLQVDLDHEVYFVWWNSGVGDTKPDGRYRAVVRVGEVVLGWQDLQEVGSRAGADHAPPGYLPFVLGFHVPLRFRVETGIAGSVEVTPPTAELPDAAASPGPSADFAATVRDLYGVPLPGLEVGWASGTPELVGVAPSSGVTDAAGRTTTTATVLGEVQQPTDVEIVATAGAAGGAAVLTVGVEQGQPLGPEGGTVVFPGSGLTIEAPAGALDGEVLITAVPAAGLPPGGPPIVPGTAWDFGPDGLAFLTPVTLTIPFDPAALPPGTDPSDLRIHKLVGDTYVQMDAGLVDLAANTVSAEVDGFSVFVLLERGSPEDVTAPIVTAIEVLDPATGLFGPSASIDVSAGDQPVAFRISATDDLSGVGRPPGSLDWTMSLGVEGGEGVDTRFFCLVEDFPPTEGSDTNGRWVCEGVWRQYSPSGPSGVRLATVQDKVGNERVYAVRGDGAVCDVSPGTAGCIDPGALFVLSVTSDPEDLDRPRVSDVAVSLDTDPRVPSDNVLVNVAGGFQWLVFQFQLTDDLSGAQVESFLVEGPSGQQTNWFCGAETPVEGSVTAGTWECRLLVGSSVEEGRWSIRGFVLYDRVGRISQYQIDSPGRACAFEEPADCIEGLPTFDVISLSDAEAPLLTGFRLSVSGATVTVSMDLTDDVGGVGSAWVEFESATTTQSQRCFGQLVAGDRLDGTWECSFTFPEFSAKGAWLLDGFRPVWLRDAGLNERTYRRGAADGILCAEIGGVEVCQDFGQTDIVVS